MSRWTEKLELLRQAWSVGVGSDVTVATSADMIHENRRIPPGSAGSDVTPFECTETLPRSTLLRGPVAWGSAGLVWSVGGIVPTRYLNAFTDMSCVRPEHVSDERWRQVHDDARTFLREWGAVADALGWPTEELFGRAEVGAHGLVWELCGRRVLAITHDLIVIDGDAARYRAWFPRMRRG